MEIGIGLPSGIPGTGRELFIEWAKRADEGPFSSLGVIDRLVYPNLEPVVALAAAAAVTRRARLISVILMASLRNTGVFAKEAASIDVLSNGRLTLGLAVGSRLDDFRAAPASPKGRGKRFEEQLALMRRVWSGGAAVEGDAPLGPPPVQAGGPPVLIGGSVPAALRRAGRLGDGYVAGTRDPQQVAEAFEIVQTAWKDAGRPGRPRLAVIRYFALGPGTEERGAATLRHYYGSTGANPERAVQAMTSSAERMRELQKEFEDVGVDELLWMPTVPDVEQVDRVAEVVSH